MDGNEIRQMPGQLLQGDLAELAGGALGQGYVQDRSPGAGGPCYQWTRKVKGKTASVALSKEQYEALRKAIEHWRQLQATLRAMQGLSRQLIFGTLPDTQRRKRLTERALGLN